MTTMHCLCKYLLECFFVFTQTRTQNSLLRNFTCNTLKFDLQQSQNIDLQNWIKLIESDKISHFAVGADPADKMGMHYSPLQMAAEQGAVRSLAVALSCLPAHRQRDKKVKDSILQTLFQTSCYECVQGTSAVPCVRCQREKTGHSENVSFTGCIDLLIDSGYRPSAEFVLSLADTESKADLHTYLCHRLEGGKAIPSKDVKRKVHCGNCRVGGFKMMKCSRCHLVHYCSKTCQKADWKQHKQVCNPRMP